MRRISLDRVRPGMTLAKAVLGGTGQVLLRKGVGIKPQYISYLQQLGVHHIYIHDSRIEDVEVSDVINEETRYEARSLVKNIMKNVKSPANNVKSLNVDDRSIIETVTKIVDELLENKDLLVQLVDIRTKDDYLFAHSVNCTVLATLVATKMGYDMKQLKLLAMGTLLHDIGMVTVPELILKKSGDLTEDEYETVKKHPEYGYEIFKKTNLFDARAGAVILQHHERYHGQGYPRGISGDKINHLAQIVSIVDVYDALTSEKFHRKAYYPHQAVEMLMARGGEYFEMNILNKFLSVIAAYPVGFHVFLSNGESGLVIANNPGLTLRPVVRVLYTGEDLAPHPSPYDLDLSQSLDLTITGVIE